MDYFDYTYWGRCSSYKSVLPSGLASNIFAVCTGFDKARRIDCSHKQDTLLVQNSSNSLDAYTGLILYTEQ